MKTDFIQIKNSCNLIVRLSTKKRIVYEKNFTRT